MNRRELGPAMLVGAALALGSCAGPVAGDLTVSLVTPNSADGALRGSVTASESQELTGAAVACSGCQMFKEQPSATQIVAVVTGDVVAGPLVRVSVTDTKAPSSYTVRIQQVASRTYQVRSTNGYSLTIGQ
jgi:hypothetical protein